MSRRSLPDRRTISNVIMTLAVIVGLTLCYFLAVPFLAAIVWSLPLGVLFAPLDKRIRRSIPSPAASAAVTVAVVACVVVVPGIMGACARLGEAAKSATGSSSRLQADRWTHLID